MHITTNTTILKMTAFVVVSCKYLAYAAMKARTGEDKIP
jgi:hypothetical protein